MNNESFSMSSTEKEHHNSSNIDKMKPTAITRERSSGANLEANDNVENVADIDSPTTITDIQSPPFTVENIEVRNPENIDQEKIFEVLNQRFQTKFNNWEKKARVLDWANFVVTITVIIIQLFQALLLIIMGNNLSDTAKTAIPAASAAITSALIAVQLKLSWNVKANIARQSAKFYGLLNTDLTYRLGMVRAGGKFNDVIEWWNTARQYETKVPPFIHIA